MKRDRLYSVPKREVSAFNFGPETAAVFDDMLQRSVPLYAEIQRMIGEIAEDLAVDNTNVYDLGCSTCGTFRVLQGLSKDVTFIGVDDSAAMLERAEEELKRVSFGRRYELRCQDLHKDISIVNASVVIMSLTLQFLRPTAREQVMRTVFEALTPQGGLILVEKVLAPETLVNRLFIKYYHDLKRRNGYSELEIAQKREALENVLVPYRMDENEALLRATGFRCIEPFFRWYNFCGILALK